MRTVLVSGRTICAFASILHRFGPPFGWRIAAGAGVNLGTGFGPSPGLHSQIFYRGLETSSGFSGF
jgi:hypothetical protein